MRHVYIRGILGMVWMGSAAVCGAAGNFRMAVFYGLLCGLCLRSAWAVYRKERTQKGGR